MENHLSGIKIDTDVNVTYLYLNVYIRNPYMYKIKYSFSTQNK